MAKPWAKAFYSSAAWEHCRTSYISERILADGGLCEICHEELGYIVHHVKELTPANISDPNVSLNHSNLQYVCKKCHDKTHGVFCESEQKYFFDGDGQIQPYPPIKIEHSFDPPPGGATSKNNAGIIFDPPPQII